MAYIYADVYLPIRQITLERRVMKIVRPITFLKTGDIILARHHVPTDTAFGKAFDAAFGQDLLGLFVSRYPLTRNVHNGFYPAHGGLYIASKQNDEATGLTWDEVCEFARSKEHLHVTRAMFELRGMVVSSGPRDVKTLFGAVDPGAGVQAWNMPEYLEVDSDGLYTYQSSQGERNLMFLRLCRFYHAFYCYPVSDLDLEGIALAAGYGQGEKVTLVGTPQLLAKRALGFLGLGYDVPQMAGVVTLALQGRLDKPNPFDPPHLMNCAEVVTDALEKERHELHIVHPQIPGRSLLWWMWTPNWVKRALMKFAKKRPVHASNLTWIAGLLESPVLKEVRHG